MNQWLSSTLAIEVLVVVCSGAVLRAIHHGVRKIMAALDDVTATVHQTLTVQASAVTLLNSLKEKLDAAIAASANDDGAALEQLSTDLGSSTTALASAVAANTVADPVHVANTQGATSSATGPTVPVPTPAPDPVPAPTPPITTS